MANATIENIEFTLFYDYDQLRDRKLTKLNDEGKIEWLQARMEMIFLEPVRRIISDESQPHPVLHSSEHDPVPPRTAAILAFSIVLNGVEAVGSFITPAGGNGQRFKTFMKSYMKKWDKSVKKTDYTDTSLVSILWSISEMELHINLRLKVVVWSINTRNAGLFVSECYRSIHACSLTILNVALITSSAMCEGLVQPSEYYS